jgi:hypothetical protein
MVKRLILCVVLTLIASACTGGGPRATVSPTVAPPIAGPSPSPLPPTSTLPLTATATVPPASPTPVASPPAGPTATPVVYGPKNFPSGYDPLTGLQVVDPKLLERRPVAVKVQLFPRGQRPPWGVSLADIVYDYYQNFGLTRLHAIFYGRDAETVGPIRSARLLDLDLVKMYKTIFAFGSAEQRTYSRLFSADFAPRLVVEGKAKCPPLCRIEPNTFNYLVTNTAELGKYAVSQGVDNVRQNLDGMTFSTLPRGANQPGQNVYVRFSISSYERWDYDSASGRYLRFQDTREAYDLQSEGYDALIDQLTGQQIAADNVVVVIVPHQYTFESRPGPNEVIEFLLTSEGTGPAYAFRDGKAYQVTWGRPGKESVLVLGFSDGTPYYLKPGTTWFILVGKTSEIDTDQAGAWRFQHHIP